MDCFFQSRNLAVFLMNYGKLIQGFIAHIRTLLNFLNEIHKEGKKRILQILFTLKNVFHISRYKDEHKEFT